jgi:D-3-phosphoglycerate dehydrogenase
MSWEPPVKRPRIVVTDHRRHPTYDEERRVLEELGAELVLADCATSAEVSAACAEADGVLANLAPVDAAAITAMRRCRVISRYGVGYDNVDVPSATARGIWVANVPDYCGEDVSDHALALLLAVARRVTARDRAVRAGAWNAAVGAVRRIEGKTVGLIGFGQVARALARKLAAFRPARILASDPYQDAAAIARGGVVKVATEELLRESDYVSLHAPASGETRHLIDAAALSLMRPEAILVNTSRGPLVDEAALAAALAAGRLGGAGLDVFEREPLPADSPLRGLDGVVLTDHAAWYSVEAMSELKTKAARNIVAVLAGGRPPYPLNQPVAVAVGGRR